MFQLIAQNLKGLISMEIIMYGKACALADLLQLNEVILCKIIPNIIKPGILSKNLW